MKKILAIIMTILISVPIFITDASAEENKTDNILVLGDSISSGYGLEGYNEDRYSARSYSMILKDKLDSSAIKNYATDGYTSSQLLSLLKSGKVDEDIKNADIVVFSIGGNDVLNCFVEILEKTVSDITLGSLQNLEQTLNDALENLTYENKKESYDGILSEFKANYISILDYIINTNKNIKIYPLTLYNPLSVPLIPQSTRETADILCQDISKTIIDNSSDNVVVADVASAFKGKTLVYTNMTKMDIHPNAKGHELIAELVYDAINNITYTDASGAVTESSETTEADAEDVIVQPESADTSPLETFPPVLPDSTETGSSGNGTNMLLIAILTGVLAVIVCLLVLIKLNKKNGKQ